MPKRTARKTVGRPRIEPTEADITRIEQLAKDHFGVLQIARGLGIGSGTLARWREEHPAVDEALEMGREWLHHELKSKLIEKALGGETVPLLFALKVFFGYREGEPVAAVQINNTVAMLTPHEVQQIVRSIAAEV